MLHADCIDSEIWLWDSNCPAWLKSFYKVHPKAQQHLKPPTALFHGIIPWGPGWPQPPLDYPPSRSAARQKGRCPKCCQRSKVENSSAGHRCKSWRKPHNGQTQTQTFTGFLVFLNPMGDMDWWDSFHTPIPRMCCQSSAISKFLWYLWTRVRVRVQSQHPQPWTPPGSKL